MATKQDLEDEKLVTLSNLEDLVKHIERNIPVYTMAEYEQIKDNIPIDTFFAISDDGISMSAVQEMQVDDDDIDDLLDDTTPPSEEGDDMDDMFND